MQGVYSFQMTGDINPDDYIGAELKGGIDGKFIRGPAIDEKHIGCNDGGINPRDGTTRHDGFSEITGGDKYLLSGDEICSYASKGDFKQVEIGYGDQDV